MSRRSQAFAAGTQKFSWRVEEIRERDAAAPGRFKATCKTSPDIFAFGETEQGALGAAQRKLDTAIETAAIDTSSPGQW